MVYVPWEGESLGKTRKGLAKLAGRAMISHNASRRKCHWKAAGNQDGVVCQTLPAEAEDAFLTQRAVVKVLATYNWCVRRRRDVAFKCLFMNSS